MKEKTFVAVQGMGLSVLLSVAPVAAAQQMPPDTLSAGGVNAGVDQQRGWQPKKDDVDVDVDIKIPEMKGSDIRIRVTKLQFIGLEDTIKESDLQTFSAAYVQPEMSINDLWKVAGNVTNYLHDEGYMSHTAGAGDKGRRRDDARPDRAL